MTEFEHWVQVRVYNTRDKPLFTNLHKKMNKHTHTHRNIKNTQMKLYTKKTKTDTEINRQKIIRNIIIRKSFKNHWNT